jgi:hypothetical protein
LAVRLDSFFNIASKVLIEDGVGAAGFQGCDHIRNLPTLYGWSIQHRDRSAIPFDYHLHALLNLRQHSVQSAGKFSFCTRSVISS